MCRRGYHYAKLLIGCMMAVASIAPGLAICASSSVAQELKTAEARRLLVARDMTGAISAMRAAVAQESRTHGADSHEVAVALSRLGLLAMARSGPDFDEAKKAYERALHIREMRWGLSDPTTALVLEDLARLYLAEATDSPGSAQKIATARRLLGRALRIRKRRGFNQPAVADALYNLAAAFQMDKPFDTEVVGLHRKPCRSVRECSDQTACRLPKV